MANTPRAEVAIEIAGRPYVLKFGAGWIRRMEEQYPDSQGRPRSFSEILPRTNDGRIKLPLSMVSRSLWNALQPHEYDTFPTLDTLEEAIGSLNNMKNAAAKVAEGLAKAYEVPARPPEGAPAQSAPETTKAAPQIGTASSDEQR